MTIISYSGDQFGYYTVGTDFKTYSKLLAIEETRRSGSHLEWHFNKSTYGHYDWTKEPSCGLSELYRRRAQDIRDNYDYVVVWYSGGPDSWCVLNSFLENDIRIDEIANFFSYAADGDKHNNFNEEIFYTAIPNSQKIVDKKPWIKHRVVDVSQMILDVYQRPEMRFDYIYNIKAIASANSLARSYLRDFIDDYRAIIDSGKRLCFVWGTEKPRLIVKDGKYHVLFIDAFSDTNIRIQGLADQGYYDEWFFWGPTCMDLIAKQCHLLKNVLELEPISSSKLSAKSNFSHIPRSRRTGLYLDNDFYHTLIYPGWQPDTLVADKPRNLLLSERDDWFWKQRFHTNPGVRYAKNGLKELVKRFGKEWLNNATDPTKGIKGCINLYPLE